MILPLEKQVPGRELCQRMKELGFSQDSAFYYGKPNRTGNIKYELFLMVNRGNRLDKGYIITNHNKFPDHIYNRSRLYDFIKSVSAPTVAELGEMLPEKIKVDDKMYRLWGLKGRGNWEARYLNNAERYDSFCSESDFTEADARARMWIHLRENKLI